MIKNTIKIGLLVAILIFVYVGLVKAEGGKMWLEGKEAIDRVQELVSLMKLNKIEKIELPVKISGELWQIIEKDMSLKKLKYNIVGIVNIKRYLETYVILDSDIAEDVNIAAVFDSKTQKFKFFIKLSGA